MADQLAHLKAALAARYALERELGRGGMATVYLARDLRHGRLVAIKVLRPEIAAALGPERFLREIQTAARLTHPHILPLHDSGEAAGSLFYVMPYIEGESLRDRLEREGQLPLEEALRISREVAAALSYAHSHDVVHRDIKPENILLSGGEAVVADFGIARAITAAARGKLTETGIAIGTPGYMSPEQGAASARVDERSDIYSLACVLYEMLAGEPPFTGPSAESIVRQHRAAAGQRDARGDAACDRGSDHAGARQGARRPLRHRRRVRGGPRSAGAAHARSGTPNVPPRSRGWARCDPGCSGGRPLRTVPAARHTGLGGPYQPIDCRAAVREREWRPAGGIPERRHQRRAHQCALEAAPAPGRGPPVVVRIQGEERGRAADRSGVARGDRARRERAPGRQPPARDGAADRRPERIQPLVGDLRPSDGGRLRAGGRDLPRDHAGPTGAPGERRQPDALAPPDPRRRGVPAVSQGTLLLRQGGLRPHPAGVGVLPRGPGA